MLILLLLYLASQSWAKEVPRDSNYTLKYVSSCPDSGYFFQREPAPNALMGPCYLCFCQGRNTAICWARENRKCDLKHYKHSSIAKKEARVRRSPLGFGDVFFKDAAREMFNKGQPEVCKPYESSFSEGCPPADWCTGCTVCDCDADGHWDCHILSFCDDEKGKGNKKSNKKGKSGTIINYPKPKNSAKQKRTSTAVPNKRPPSRTKSTTKKPPAKNSQKRAGPISLKKPRSFIQKGKPAKPLIIKKNEQKPKILKNSPSKKVLNGSETDMNEQIMKTMMTTMQKMWTKQVTSALPDIVRMIQKRSFGNRTQAQKARKPVKYKKQTPAKKSGNTHTYNRSLFVRKQKRLEQKKEMQQKKEIQEALAAKNNTTKKQVPKAVNRNNKPINRSNNRRAPAKKATTNKPNSKPNNKSNKLKNNPNNKQQNNYNIRKKREVTFINQTDSLHTYNYSDIALTPKFNVQSATKQEVTINSPSNTSQIDDSVTSNTNYYAYSVQVTTDNPGVRNDTNYNATNVEVIVKKVDGETDSSQQHEKDKLRVADKIPNEVANDIKLTKWSEIKMFQVKENATNLNLNRTEQPEKKVIHKINGTKINEGEGSRKQIIRNDIERKIYRTTKKYSLHRKINRKNCKRRSNDINLKNDFGTSLSSKIENLRNVLKRLLSEFRGSNSSNFENKNKKKNAIKYLKKFFNKIFYNDSNKTNINQRMRNNNHTIQMLCESFGPCVINRRNKRILMKKIRQLNNETVQIIKNLRIIRGLIRLVDIPLDKSVVPFNKTSNFKRDIHKLNVILKKSFDDEEYHKNLSESQRIQINYIKQNTKVFTQSVAKFTKILNEIIDLISIESNNKKRNWHSTVSKSNATEVKATKKFKKLLQNYNILHNAFIAKMIDMFKKLQFSHQVVNKTTLNNTVDVTGGDYYSQRVISNINKLKNLASALNPLRRQKRHAIRQDNAVEYLLMLMEYMFQKNQLNNPPVNDGIDMLIEAIKNAPDIKSVKKKVLENNYLKTNYDQILIPVSNKNRTYEDSVSDNYISDQDSLNKVSNEDSMLNKISVDDSKSISHSNDNSSSFEQGETIDDENELSTQPMKFLSTVTVNDLSETDINNMIGRHNMNLTSVDNQDNQEPKYEQGDYQRRTDYETSTEKPSKVYMAKDEALAVFDTRLASGEYNKKTNVYNSELDEESNIEESLGVTKAASIHEEISESPIVTTGYKDESENYVRATNVIKFKPIPEDDRYKGNEKKTKLSNNGELKSLEWIDDVKAEDNNEIQPYNNTLDESVTKPTKVKDNHYAETTDRVATNFVKKKPAQVIEIELSDGSKEDSEEKSKDKTMKAEDVMIKKEQDLLNSLDYGTETAIVEDSESKDGAEEKFLNDYFAE